MMISRRRGDAVENIHDTHDQVVHPAAKISGNTAQNNAQKCLDDYNDKADDQRNTAAVHQSGQHIHAGGIGAQPVLLEGRGIPVIDIGLGALKHRPAVGISLIGNGIGGLLPLGVCIDKLLGAAINGLLQLFLKVTADHYAVFLTLNNKAADIGDHGAAVHHIAVGVQLIGLSVCLKGVFAIYIGLQGRRLYVEAGSA